MNYYEWKFDGTVENTWFVDPPGDINGRDVSAWAFMSVTPFDIQEYSLSASISSGSVITNVCFSAFKIIYVRSALAKILKDLLKEQIQLIPVNVTGIDEDVFILNILNECRCIDESRSVFEKWEQGNSVRSDKVGMYKSIFDLAIDSSQTKGFEIFRPWGWRMAVIVSERIMNAIESVGADGTKFELVSVTLH